MKPNLYVNTGKVGHVVGLIVVTCLTSYVTTNSTKIVEGTVAAAKNGLEKANEILHHGKKQYSVCERTFDGRIIDTGKRIWR